VGHGMTCWVHFEVWEAAFLSCYLPYRRSLCGRDGPDMDKRALHCIGFRDMDIPSHIASPGGLVHQRTIFRASRLPKGSEIQERFVEPYLSLVAVHDNAVFVHTESDSWERCLTNKHVEPRNLLHGDLLQGNSGSCVTHNMLLILMLIHNMYPSYAAVRGRVISHTLNPATPRILNQSPLTRPSACPA
jgi:hypothetical protein